MRSVNNICIFHLLSLLKRLQVIAYCLLAFSLYGFTQEPPPYFVFDYRQLATDKDRLLQQYEFTTFNFRDSIQTEQGNMFDWEKERLVKYVTNTAAAIFIYSESLAIPYEGSIIRLTIVKKGAPKAMNIFIRVSHNIGFGDPIALKNLRFLPGDYFLDMCQSYRKYELYQPPSFVTKTIHLDKISGRKISLTKLNDIIKNHSCFPTINN